MAAPTNSPEASLKSFDEFFNLLPDELFGVIVAKLPLLYMFRLRRVCKQWNATLHDTFFLEKHFQLTRRAPLYVWRTVEGYAAYSPESNSWHMWPASFISKDDSGHKVYGGVDGLLLVEVHVNSKERDVYLANPITRSFRKLSKVPSWDLLILGMVFDQSSRSYKVFGVRYGSRRDEYRFEYGDEPLDSSLEHNRYGNTLYVYDSELDSWKIIVKWATGRRDFFLPTFLRGVLHCLITEYEANQPVYKVLCSDSGQSWHRLTAQIPRELQFVHMFEWQGNLMVIGSIGLSSVEVWQLDEEKNVWVKSMTMPDDMLHRLFPSEPRSSLRLHCDSSAAYVSLTSYSRDPACRRRYVMCNLSDTSWWEVTEPPSLYKPPLYLGGLGVARYFLWKPSFDKIY